MTEPKDIDLKRGYQECRRQTRLHARTFFFASHVLPPGKRAAAYAVYAFCRRVDNVVDLGDAIDPRLQLGELRDILDRIYGEGATLDGPSMALRDTVRRYAIPLEYFHDLIRGVELDLTKTRYQNFTELNDYCYCVASVVGLMMSRIFGVSDPKVLERALEMGTAMQLTNILRDVGEDYRMGRIYLPQQELQAFGYSEEDLANSRVDESFVRLMQFQIARARDYYQRAAAGIESIPDDGSQTCARLMSTAYAAILDRIEANHYDVFRLRAFVPLAGKLRIAARSFLRRQKTEPALAIRPRVNHHPRGSGPAPHAASHGPHRGDSL